MRNHVENHGVFFSRVRRGGRIRPNSQKSCGITKVCTKYITSMEIFYAEVALSVLGPAIAILTFVITIITSIVIVTSRYAAFEARQGVIVTQLKERIVTVEQDQKQLEKNVKESNERFYEKVGEKFDKIQSDLVALRMLIGDFREDIAHMRGKQEADQTGRTRPIR